MSFEEISEKSAEDNQSEVRSQISGQAKRSNTVGKPRVPNLKGLQGMKPEEEQKEEYNLSA